MSGGEKTQRASEDPAWYARRHLRIGWWLLLVFLTLGIVLESLHGFKVAWYLNPSSEARQLMWRLAHAHGTLLGLLHLGFAATVTIAPSMAERPRRLASRCLLGASILLPGGFFLGGVAIYGGDPGLGVLLVPVGAVLLFAAVLAVALAVRGENA
jgi:hypothetical protein